MMMHIGDFDQPIARGIIQQRLRDILQVEITVGKCACRGFYAKRTDIEHSISVSADTLAELFNRVQNTYQRSGMVPTDAYTMEHKLHDEYLSMQTLGISEE